MQNSDLFFPETDTPLIINGYHDSKLLITTTYASLYRLSKAGRYFLIKPQKRIRHRLVPCSDANTSLQSDVTIPTWFMSTSSKRTAPWGRVLSWNISKAVHWTVF